MKNSKLKIGIDLDDTITASIESINFFSLITNLLKEKADIYIITNRIDEKPPKKILEDFNIHYDYLILTGKKTEYIIENKINIYFDDTDEYFLELPESITVFKIRESGNFDFNEHKWIYDKRTGIDIGKKENKIMDKKLYSPFYKDILKRASKLAKKYHINIEKDNRLGFVGNCVEIPTVFFDGKTEKECKKIGREAITVTLATMLEISSKLPQPNNTKEIG